MTAAALGFSQPAEWEPHRACWLAWPSHGDLWLDELPAAQAEFTGLCRAIADGPGGEFLEILVPDANAERAARVALDGLPARFHSIPFGDIWMRDIAPVFLLSAARERACVAFRFNGWGEKYILPHDNEVSLRVAEASGVRAFKEDWILEGGSVEVDGEGTCLTTEQCLLNPNRNPGISRPEIEKRLRASLGVEKILWLKDGLLNDHTDGHIDTIARFVAPGVVVCMKAEDPATDPNFEVLEAIARDLAALTDARGRKLRVVRVPSPGRILGHDGRIAPASYVNFYIGNRTVVVPTYGSRYDTLAVSRIGELFPGRKTVGLPAYAILAGGGAFHCITQQEPSERTIR